MCFCAGMMCYMCLCESCDLMNGDMCGDCQDSNGGYMDSFTGDD